MNHLADEAERAADFRVDDDWLFIEIELSRLDDEAYRTSLLDQAKAWRGGSDRSTIYVFSYGEPVPQQLISTLRNAADGALTAIDEPRGLPLAPATAQVRFQQR